ncbi:uncharacterized protein LOC135092979 [Scylla paramamosain]|uniref:uncharacterized protein LOC135092979 n=1 Tax=Scylla paramamosain TaxID=85552 RepID=UPI003082DFB3
MAPLPALITRENFKTFLESFDTVLTDCGWCVWDRLIGQAHVTLNTLQALGKKVFFVTNNSTKSRDDYVEKCGCLGFKATKEDILSSAYVLAQYLKQQGFQKVYVMGMGGIVKELQAEGIQSTGREPVRGTGCVVRCVETVAERLATVMGKPSTKMFSVIQEKNSLDPKRTLMIEAKHFRCNTDILFGKNCGLQTLVVLSGVTTQADLEKWAASDDPEQHALLADYCLTQLDDLLAFLDPKQEQC